MYNWGSVFGCSWWIISYMQSVLTQVGKKSGAADRAADEEDNTMENV